MGAFLRHTWDLLLKGGMAVAGFFVGMVSSGNEPIKLLLALMVADYLTGVGAAVLKKSPQTKRGGLSSDVGMKGLLRKGLMLLVVAVAYTLDGFVANGTVMFQSAVTWFYISNEGISLVENLGYCGVPIPPKLRMALEHLSEDSSGSPIAPSGEGTTPADTAATDTAPTDTASAARGASASGDTPAAPEQGSNG